MEEFDFELFSKYYLSGISNCRCAIKPIDLEFQRQYSRLIQFQAVCDPEDWTQFNHLIKSIPEERDKDMRGLLIHGFNLKEAYNLLKETYNF